MKLLKIAVLFLLPVACPAQSMLALATRYNASLREFERGHQTIPLERVLRKGKILSDKTDDLEKLSAADYATFKKRMRGFVINREEIVFTEPDANFFYRLALRRGTAADKSFFRLLREFKPYGVWPTHVEQQTDVTGCTSYGNGRLTRLYGHALNFRRSFPRSYASFVNQEIRDIREQFDPNLCACGGRESVIREFTLFVKTYPKEKKTSQIRATLRRLKYDKGFRFNCHSG
ncbi:MAG: hypothetical protein JO314_01440 [Acidobacteria bacterium]|nr:hypothetical protein [Acidobacteriota bacterium]